MKLYPMVVFLCAAASTAGVAQASRPSREPLVRERDLPVAKNAALAPGSYMLVLTPARLGGKPAPRATRPIASSVTVSRSGGKLSVSNAKGLALSGSATGARFTVSGQNGDGKLILTGAAESGGADGDFELTFIGGPRVEGGFVLTSPNSAGLQASRKLQDYDEAPKNQNTDQACNWWCTVRGWVER